MRVSLVVLVGLLWGCGSSAPRPNVPTPAPHATKHATKHATEQTVREPLPETIERRNPQAPESCPLFFPPHDVGSVVRIPGKMMALAMNPVMQALCACSNPGEYATIVARIDYGSGTVKLEAPDNPAINECVQSVPVSFVPPPPSDLPGSDCINCGPRYYGVFADSPPPPKEPALQLIYSLLVDRSNEVLDCPDHTHAERGQCKSDDAPTPEKPEKRSCKCEPSDLKCAIECASKT